MLKKLLILIGAIVFLIIVVFVIQNTDNKKANVSEYDDELVDALQVAVHYDVERMGYQKYYDDELSGFEIDFAKQLAKYIYGKESLIELNSASNKTAMYLLDNKTVDAVIATQPITDEKNEKYSFSDSYYTDYIECVYEQGNILSLRDLANKKIGVVENSFSHKALQKAMKNDKIEGIFVSFESYSDGIDALKRNKIDVFCINRGFLPIGSSLKRFTIGECKYGVVVRKEDGALLKKINEAIGSLSSSGELTLMSDKWK